MNKMPARLGPLILSGVAAFGALPLVSAWAQESGLEITATIKETLRSSDNLERIANPSGRSTIAQTDLTFGLTSETQTQQLAAQFGGTIEAGYFADRDDNDPDFSQSFFNLNYAREVQSALLSFDAVYRKSDVRDTDFASDFDDRDLIVDQGELASYGLSFGLETGRDAPFGLTFDVALRERNYSNTTDEDLFDSETQSYDFAARFDLSQTATLRALAEYSEYDAQDSEDTLRESTSFGFGLGYEISPSLRFNGQITHDRTETTETLSGTRRQTVDQGPSYEFGLTLDRPNGTIGTRYNSIVRSTGRRSTFWLDRTLDLPRGGLEVSLGVTESDDTSSRAIGNLAYSHELPSGAFTANLSQSATTRNEDNDEAVRTSLTLGYDHQITAISRIGASANFADLNVISGTGNDTERSTFAITYSREVTRDWDLTTGFEHSYSKEDTQSNRTSNTVFLGLERSFSFRP